MAGFAKAKRALVLATSSRGKLEEFLTLLREFPVEVRPIDDVVAQPRRVEEDGATFTENAIKKARAAALETGLLSLADDSGLEVDALGGQPSVRSARFARDGATDSENNAALLSAIEALGRRRPREPERLCARFRCVLALVDPLVRTPGLAKPTLWTVEGVCEGFIARAPRGSGGFGYDPLFIPAGSNKTMAELDREEKNRISHRARAVAALRPILRSLAQ
jgi:XTP/dITP diphosphohydrolase